MQKVTTDQNGAQSLQAIATLHGQKAFISRPRNL